MEDEMKTTQPYAEIAEILKTQLTLVGSPVAVKLAKTREAIPQGIEELQETIRHCQMVSLARKEGKIFYATAERHQCAGGGWALGLKEQAPSLKTGEFYFKLGKFESWAACRRTIEQVPHLGTKETYATVYAPLEKTPFSPHVVIIVASPRGMLKLAQSVLYTMGGRLHGTMAGIQSVCSDATAYPYLSGALNFSLGCDGSRKFSGIADSEMVMGIPGERIGEVARTVRIITGAPGSG